MGSIFGHDEKVLIFFTTVQKETFPYFCILCVLKKSVISFERHTNLESIDMLLETSNYEPYHISKN